MSFEDVKYIIYCCFLSLVGIFEMPQYDGKKFLNGCYTSRAPLTTESRFFTTCQRQL